MSFAKADQLLELAGLVGGKYLGATLDDVIERFNCSHRTAQRMMGALESRFPDVTWAIGDDGRKRWKMEGNHFRELMTVSPDELAAMELAIGDLRRSGHTREVADLRRLKDKILSFVPRKSRVRIETDHEALLEAQGFVARPGPRPKVDETCAVAIAEAIKGCRLLELAYQARTDSKPKMRRVAPYGILSGMRRYLIGASYDHRARPIRSYRLDAVTAATVSKDSFVRPDDFDLQAYANRAFGVYQNDDEFSEVVWQFTPAAADQARGYLFHPEQTIEDQPDGSLLFRFRASGYLEMCWHLYCWGDKVEVLKPLELKAMTEGFRRADFAAMP